MHLKKIAQIAWKGLTRNKLRSLLTMLGVIIGVAAVIVMISISAGTEKAIRDRITGLGSNLVYVQAAFSRGGPMMQSSGGGLVYDDAWAIRDNLSGVKSVDVTQNSSESVKSGDVTVEDVTIMGTTTGFPSVRDMTLAAGRYVTQNDIDRKARRGCAWLQPGCGAVRQHLAGGAGGHRRRCQADRGGRFRD